MKTSELDKLETRSRISDEQLADLRDRLQSDNEIIERQKSMIE